MVAKTADASVKLSQIDRNNIRLVAQLAKEGRISEAERVVFNTFRTSAAADAAVADTRKALNAALVDAAEYHIKSGNVFLARRVLSEVADYIINEDPAQRMLSKSMDKLSKNGNVSLIAEISKEFHFLIRPEVILRVEPVAVREIVELAMKGEIRKATHIANAFGIADKTITTAYMSKMKRLLRG
jgi:hypothetical protein